MNYNISVLYILRKTFCKMSITNKATDNLFKQCNCQTNVYNIRAKFLSAGTKIGDFKDGKVTISEEVITLSPDALLALSLIALEQKDLPSLQELLVSDIIINEKKIKISDYKNEISKEIDKQFPDVEGLKKAVQDRLNEIPNKNSNYTDSTNSSRGKQKGGFDPITICFTIITVALCVLLLGALTKIAVDTVAAQARRNQFWEKWHDGGKRSSRRKSKKSKKSKKPKKKSLKRRRTSKK